MAKLHYTEMFYSIQGEGLHTGAPSVFLRTFGCNLKCEGFGMPVGEKSQWRHVIAADLAANPDKYPLMTDLPLVRTGCDSYASWDPRFKKFVHKEEIEDIANKVLALTPHNAWNNHKGSNTHLIITGGEPLLGWQRLWSEFLRQEAFATLTDLTFETNTTQKLHPDLIRWICNSEVRTTFSCSAKLGASGEDWNKAIRPEIAKSYYDLLGPEDMYFKFVISKPEDIEDVKRAVDEFYSAGVEVPIYVMPVGGCLEEYMINAKIVADIAMEHGWNFSPREHLILFGNAWAT